MADHMNTTGHNIKWDHFDFLASGKTDFQVFQCKIEETLFIQELKPSLNVSVSSAMKSVRQVDVLLQIILFFSLDFRPLIFTINTVSKTLQQSLLKMYVD